MIGVIGAGYIGVCCALELRQRGHEVVLIDPGEPEKAASYGNSGQFAVDELVPLAVPGIIYSVPGWLMDPLGRLTIRWRDLPELTPWLFRFAAASRSSRVQEGSKAMAVLCARMHDDYAPLLRAADAQQLISEIDCIKLYKSKAAWEAESYVWNFRTEAGLQFEHLSHSRLEELEPEMSDYAQFGVAIKGRKYIRNPGRLLQKLTQLFIDNGGRKITGEVDKLEKNGRDVTGVYLKTGDRVQLSSVVIAAGIDSLALSKQLGDKVPLVSERGYHLMLPEPGINVQRACTLGWAGMGISPMEEGLRLAGTVELASRNAPANFARAHNLLVHARMLFPGLDSQGARQWMGHRPSFPDSLPIIDRASKFDNVIYAFGHGHMGVGWAATTGQMVAVIQEGRSFHIDMKPYGLARF